MAEQNIVFDNYEKYKQTLQRIADVKYAAAMLQWDQETYLPPKGADTRARQVATLSEISHSMFIDPSFGSLLNSFQKENKSEDEEHNTRLTKEDYDKNIKLSSTFIRKISEAVSAAFHAWIEARKQNDFKIFEPALTQVVKLKRQEAELLGYQEHPYDALLNEFEKGMTVQELDTIFADVKRPLKDLLKEIQQQPAPDDSFLSKHYPKDKQWEWGMFLAKDLGFNFEAGRQDISEHPFTINFSSKDVRITTRIDENDFTNMTWSTIHEVGHALYEQGLPIEMYGLPLGEYTSLGIHESQSRLWENCVGRSKEFWEYYLPELKKIFPEQLADMQLDTFVQAINKIKSSFIRTEADELTYHFHVMTRYELEKRLIEGSLEVKDIPAFWNQQYLELLGVEVPDDKNGCLQDVHWGHGSFGYFPTYSLGSFYAAQFWKQAKLEIPDLNDKIYNPEILSQLLDWLRTKIHIHGRKYTSAELCNLVTGKTLDSKIFIEYLKEKIESLQIK